MRLKKYSIKSRGPCSVIIEAANRNILKAAMPDSSLLLIDGDGREITILCTEGTVCLTQPSDPEDHILCSGETFVIDKKGLVAVTALTNIHLSLLTTSS